jgi:hypothetical protein
MGIKAIFGSKDHLVRMDERAIPEIKVRRVNKDHQDKE